MLHRMFFFRFMHGHILTGLIGILLLVGIVLLIVYLTSRKYKSPSQAKASAASAAVAGTPAAHERVLAILNEQKTADGMGAAEYEERRMVLEGGRGDNHANAELVALKERYARGELTTSAYVDARNKLLGLN